MATMPHNEYPNEPIAIVGSACRFPGDSSSPSKLWELLKDPKDVLKEIPDSRFNVDGFYHEDPLHHGTSNVRHSYLLDDDIRVFDAQFFGIKPVEANSVDPQQRILLETVYEGLESAGIPLEKLQGSKTGVFVGVMSADYTELLARDVDAFPTYFASGTARSILSNRISYFFNWNGPSMTIDTACSSSLFALHLAVQSLRAGESPTAIVAGANLILTPEQFIAESKLKMLSPDGRSRMWDKDANGYARGDGVAALVLKPLSAALADGDTIECLIRETGINQDGRTKGITMPSPTAQRDLIHSTYQKAGLDLSKPADRPQYFEAHGTGTPAGDPVEAEAISTSFFGVSSGFKQSPSDVPLYVGSIKTVIGHTEGTAGVAGIIKASLALQHSVVPPNLLLNELSPAVKPFYGDVEILKQAKGWPELPEGVPRRVSVNSFGFGGANAHTILESYTTRKPEAAEADPRLPQLSPFNFSAASEKALTGLLAKYSAYLRENPSVNLRDLAWTLANRRSTLPVRVSVTALTAESLGSKLDELAKTLSGAVTSSGPATSSSSVPRILGIFTGQGAQWASMGHQLLNGSKLASDTLRRLQESLDSLPAEHAPTWTLQDELTKDKTSSRVGEAAFSQPLCTAVQIILVDLLQAAKVKLRAVVGHSSGEIAAAYAAGYLSAEDAIRIAYYRGYFLHLAKGPENSGGGAMLAVGTSYEDAQGLVELEEYAGRVTIAASNSPESQTLSGDLDAIEEVKDILEDEKKFARLLKVDKAYHSHHMRPCSGPYIEALKRAGIKALSRSGDDYPAWISSVYGEDIATIGTETLGAEYWSRNMVNQVKFTQAVEYAIGEEGPFDLGLEVGPHPALKGPVLQTVQAVAGQTIPYAGTLQRGVNDLEAFAAGLGHVWQALGAKAVDFTAFEQRSHSDGSRLVQSPTLLKDLPTYAWEHDRVYWHESRVSKAFRATALPPHQLLGTRVPDGTDNEVRWKNYLHPREIPWLVHHQIQRQIIFPAAGYLSTAVEAVLQLYGLDSVRLLDIYDVVIGQALVLEENSDVETLFSVRVTETTPESVEAVFAFYSASSKDSTALAKNASGRLRVTLGTPAHEVLPSPHRSDRDFLDVEPERFYNTVAEVGFGYTGPFRKLDQTKRRLHESTGLIQTPDIEDEGDTPLTIHPGTLDCGIQSIILAHSYPGDGRIRSIYLPTGIDRVRINPAAFAELKGPAGSKLPFYASITSDKQSDLSGDVELHSPDNTVVLVQLQGLRTTPLTPASVSNDEHLFFETVWEAEAPTGNTQLWKDGAVSDEYDLSFSLERVAYYYVRYLDKAIPKSERADLEWHFKIFYQWADHVIDWVAKGTHPYASQEWANDSPEDILSIIQRYPDSIDLQIMRAVGENLAAAMRQEINILEAMMKDNMLTDFYAYALGMEKYVHDMVRMIGQLSHRFPRLNVLEIGAGTGGATELILNQLQGSFSSYTYTDISSGFFEKAQERFAQHRSRMVYKVLDIEKDIEEQGYTPHSFDLVIASLVLHATHNLEATLKNARKLLRPGGRLVMLELTDNDPIRFSFIFGGLPGWWLGIEDGRTLSPCVSAEEWEVVLRKTGFSPIEAITPHNRTFPLPLSVIVTQATDDRVTLLREPLAPTAHPLGLEALTILGGKTAQTAELARRVEEAVSRHYNGRTSRFESLESISQTELPFLGSLVSLLDLEDKATFEDLTADKLSGLKEVFRQSKTVIWVTRGARDDSPHRNMYKGLQRTIVKELKHLHVQFLDFASAPEVDSDTIASRLLQLEATSNWELDGGRLDFLWYQEPEILVRNGTTLVPRVRPSQQRNERYNSGRRSITHDIILDDNVVAIRSDQGSSITVEKRGNVSDLATLAGFVDVHLNHSLLHAVGLPDGTFLYLSTGQSTKNKDPVLVLSKELNSQVRVPQSWTIPLTAETDEESKQALLRIYTHLLADNILSSAKPGELIAVLDPSIALGSALVQGAADKGVQLILPTSKTTGNFTGPWYWIHPRATKHVLRNLLPSTLTRLVNIGGAPDLVATLTDIVSPTAAVQDARSLTSPQPFLVPGFLNSVPSVAGNSLQKATIATLAKPLPANGFEELPSITLAELINRPTSTSTQALVSWRSSPRVPVQLQPASKVVRFAKDKTYWMVGLTGSLGLSLSEWMARSGARFIVLSSRNPKVDEGWLKAMKNLGCLVRVFANDITNRDDVRALYKLISQTLPPIGGVAQGAMVLRDSLFPDVDIERVETVLGPKVQGSIYLNEIFDNGKPLDFFVYFSSVAYVTGNAGQSIYGAANAFMASLAAQRRRRGLAASVINIGTILGAGYVSRELTLQQQEYLQKVGHRWMSEQDAHEIFAEGVLASSPQSADSAELETGFRLDMDRTQDLVDNPPMFQHLGAKPNDDLTAGDGATRQTVKTKAQLLEATSQDQIFEILKEGFLVKLQVVLQADPNKPMLEVSLDELGADSLVAVDIRSWFLKELEVDMPVLKILNSPSVRELLVSAQEQLPRSVIPNVAGTGAANSVVPDALESTIQSETPGKALPSGSAQPSSLPSSTFEGSAASPTTPRTSAATSEADSAELETKADSKDEPSRAQEVARGLLAPLRTLPMSFGQARFWFLKHYVQDQTAFNVTTVLKLHGRLRADVLDEAVAAVGKRHEALRTYFFTDNKTKKPMQAVLQAPAFRLERHTIADEKDLDAAIQSLRNHVFDIERGEALRIQIVSISPDSHWILLGYHHIYLDGIGYINLVSDLDQAYSGTLDTTPSSQDVLQYPDFALRQITEYETGAWASELAFWREQFPTLPEPLPLLPVVGKSRRPSSSQFGSHEASFRIDRETASKISEVSRRFKVTPFHLYVAVFNILLYRYTGGQADDISIGVADGNRKDADVLRSLGIFLNVLPLRLHRSAKHTFADVLKDVKTVAQGAFANSRVPFDVLLNELDVPRVPSHSPLFQAFLNYRQNMTEARRFLGCDGELDIVAAGQTDYDISVDVLDLSASGGESLVVVAVQKDLYDAEAANILLKSYRTLLQQFVDNPAARIARPSLYPKEDVDRVLEAGRGSERPLLYPTIVHRIDAIINTYAERTALKDAHGTNLTYSGFGKRVAAIAEHLNDQGVRPGSNVGVFQTPSADWISSLLATLRVGAAYVPLDSKVGLERLSLIAQDIRPAAILVDSHTESHEFARAQHDTGIPIINVSNLPSVPASDSVPNRANSHDVAVIIYSSGSTGVPKGVTIRHSSISNYADVAPAEWGVREGEEIFLNQASYMFDVSLQQTITALGIGSTVVVVGSAARGDPALLSELIADEGITVTGATPTEYQTWARHWNPELLRESAWRFAFTWGEPISKHELREFQRLAKPDLKVIDGYGPAEATITTAHGEVPWARVTRDGNEATTPRFPLTVTPNGSVYIVDESLNAVPAGVVGEIVIGGAPVAQGYLNDANLTTAKFIPDKYSSPLFQSKGWTTAHRTGDRGRLTHDGKIILQGRIEGSTQVKLAGIRVDLQDIEASITKTNKNVDQAVVSARTSTDSGTPFLVAFVVLAESTDILPADKAQFLEDLPRKLPLPQYMRPALVIEIPRLPTNSSGKLDRRTVDAWLLPDAKESRQASSNTATELNEFETTLSRLWEEAFPQGLARRSINAQSDFFHVGGSSLSLINLQGLLKERLGLRVSLYKLFQASTLGGMAATILEDQGQDEKPQGIIDWHQEAALPIDLHRSQSLRPPHGAPYAVALTGSTGFIGREVLGLLIDDDRVSKVYCLAVRKDPSDLNTKFPSLFDHPKVVVFRGDLGLPRLGLSDLDATSIFHEDSGVDVIVHAGADVSFLKTYHSLRLINVASTREVAAFAAPRRLPVHFVSSATVARLAASPDGIFGRESIAAHPPPRDRAAADEDGYVAAKWVSEVLLERAAAKLGIPVWIHRPTSVTGEGASELDLMSNVARYAREIGAVPDTRGWGGRFDFVSVQSVARDIVKAVLDGDSSDDGGPDAAAGKVRYLFQSGEVVIDSDDVRAGAGSEAGELLPFDTWVQRAEEAGLNPLLATYLRRAAQGKLLLPRLDTK